MHPAMPKVIDCAAVKCAYNKEKRCHAIAITVGGPGDVCPLCDTEMYWRKKAGIPGQEGEVGACHKADCEYNNKLECDAQPGIHMGVHKEHADCETYIKRMK
ncbi:MAG: DUF1540 domain-containing protein [Deltaproteobacteria bacterium]